MQRRHCGLCKGTPRSVLPSGIDSGTRNGIMPLNATAFFKIKGIGWCCKRGLNSRPLPYQGSALPLSYCSAVGGGGDRRNRNPAQGGFAVLAISLPRDGFPLSGPPISLGVEGRMRSPSDPPDRETARKPAKPSGRDERLKAALKANMARRKAQAKARSAEDALGDNKSEG